MAVLNVFTNPIKLRAILCGFVISSISYPSFALSDENARATCATVHALKMIKLKNVKRIGPTGKTTKSTDPSLTKIIVDGEEIYSLGEDVALKALASSFSSVVNGCYPLVIAKDDSLYKSAPQCKIFKGLSEIQLNTLNQAAIKTMEGNARKVTDSVNEFLYCEEQLGE